MKLLNKLSLAVLVLLPGFAVAHPGHDQSMTWVHSFEAFGIVLLEAQACKKPVIGTRVGGVPEAIGKEGAGIVVEYDDADGLAKVINELLGDPKKCKRMGEIGRKRVKKHFTWGNVVDQIENVYAELI